MRLVTLVCVLLGCISNLTYRVDTNSRWWICTAVDPTSPRLSMPYRSFTAWCIPGAVYGGYARAGRPVGLPESAVTSSEVQNGVYKGTGRCFARFLRCVEVYHDLDRLDVLYRGIRAYCSLQLHQNYIVSRCSEYHRPRISFILFFFLSKPSAVTGEWIAWLFSLSWCIYAGVVHVYLHFLHKVTISKYLLHWDFI